MKRRATVLRDGIQLGRPFGIAVRVHWTFALLLAWVAWMHVSAGQSALAAVEGAGLVLAVFGCVVLHELGHALMARRFGIATRDITLYPIGGVARLDRMPTQPKQELLIALAGPAVNVGLAGALFATLVGLHGRLHGQLLPELLIANVAMAGFNLLPAFPMDGGRVLRALLALRMDRGRATRAAASVGQLMAVGFALVGVFVNPMLLLVALFVYVGAEQEARVAELAATFEGARVADAMQSRFRVLPTGASLRDAAEELLAGDQSDFPVVDPGGGPVGLLRRDTLIRAVLAGGVDQRVQEVAEPPFAVHPSDPLGTAIERMQASGVSSALVMVDGELRGLLTAENIGEWVPLRAVLRRAVAPG